MAYRLRDGRGTALTLPRRNAPTFLGAEMTRRGFGPGSMHGLGKRLVSGFRAGLFVAIA